MSGLKTNFYKQKKQIIAATTEPPKGGDFVWNGKDEDERPLSKKEMREGVNNRGGRPKSSNPKKSTTIRLDAEVLDFFKAHGKGWQTEINDILKKYVDSNHGNEHLQS